MRKIMQFVLMGCLLFIASYCPANNTMGSLEDGIPIDLIEKTCHGGSEKGNSILASIDGHYLTVVFTENLGQVSVEITTASGSPVDFLSMTTPNGYQYYIANTGDYIVTFTFLDGDEYYGEFTVTDFSNQ